MEINLIEVHGRTVLSVDYDPLRLTWAEAISAGCAACGVDPMQCTVSARPVAGTG